MQTASLKFLVVFGVSLIDSMQAHAQPLIPHADSIESTVANADLVVIAKLVKIDDGEERVNGREVHNTTIVVEETLKMGVFIDEPYQQVQIEIPRPASVLADWKKRSSRLLVAHYDNAPKETTVIDLDRDKLEVLTADFTLLRDPEAVIRAAQQALLGMPAGVKRFHAFGLKVPRELVVGTEWEKYYNTGGHLVLSVPADKRLEKKAHDFIRSASSRKRGEGARALRYFKSDENIARLRTLLDDPEDENVRKEANQALKSWGVDVEKP